MAYTKYSLTPADNNAAPPNGAPEGMLPSAVNDTMRDMMSQIRDVGDGIRGGTYTMTAPVITGGSISGTTFSSSSATITGGTINGTTIGATTASTGKFTALTNSALTSGRVTYAGTAGVLQDDADFTFNGTTLTLANDASISGLTVGKGGGANSFSTAVGQSALNATNTQDNAAFGFAAMYSNTSGGSNSAFGSYNALYSNTTGNYNCAFGRASLQGNTTGSSNSAFGYQSLYSNTTASNNTAVGYQALYSQNGSSPNVNTAVGYQAGYTNATGGADTYLGYQAGYVATGSYNSFVGYNSGSAITSGQKNTIIGAYTGNNGGLDIRTASNYIVLSDGDGNPRGFFDGSGNFTTGGAVAVVDVGSGTTDGFTSYAGGRTDISRNDAQPLNLRRRTSNGVIIGFSRDTTGTGNISVTTTSTAYNTSSDYRLKENIAPMTGALDKVKALKPVTYTWKSDGSNGEGFIAHELAEVVAGCVTGTKDAVDAEGKPVYQGIDTSFLVATLTAAIQELKAEVDSLKQQLGK